jgi:hypothetical protein
MQMLVNQKGKTGDAKKARAVREKTPSAQKTKVPRKLDKDWRARIQAGSLLERLGRNALAEKEIMTPGQIKSAEILLRKVLPDLKQTDVQGTINVQVVKMNINLGGD